MSHHMRLAFIALHKYVFTRVAAQKTSKNTPARGSSRSDQDEQCRPRVYAAAWGAGERSVNTFTTKMAACTQRGIHQPTLAPPLSAAPSFPTCRAFNLVDPQAADEEPVQQIGRHSGAELTANGAHLPAVAGSTESAQDVTATTQAITSGMA